MIIHSDTLAALKKMEAETVDCVVTSPPYFGLRDYQVDGQIGLEETLEEYLNKLLAVTAELKRVLKKSGICFWNHGDCYGGSGKGYGSRPDPKFKSGGRERTLKPENTMPAKCLALQNYRLITQMVDAQGWILRNTIIWHKPNAMPSPVKDRLTNSYEPVFMLTKSKKYYFDLDAIREPYTKPLDRWGGDKLKAKGTSEWDKGTGQGTYRDRDMRPNKAGKNPGNVWRIATQSFSGAHFATFPEKLISPMIKAGCPGSGTVLDPFCGAGTTGVVAKKLGLNFIGIELNREYIEIAKKRIDQYNSLDI